MNFLAHMDTSLLLTFVIGTANFRPLTAFFVVFVVFFHDVILFTCLAPFAFLLLCLLTCFAYLLTYLLTLLSYLLSYLLTYLLTYFVYLLFVHFGCLLTHLLLTYLLCLLTFLFTLVAYLLTYREQGNHLGWRSLRPVSIPQYFAFHLGLHFSGEHLHQTPHWN